MNRTPAVFLVFASVVLLTQGMPIVSGVAEEIPPVYETIDPYLATPAPDHLYEIPVVILRFLPTADGENLDTTKVPDYWDLGEISLAEMKARLDTFDKRIKFMLEEGSRFRGYKDPEAPPSVGYRVVEYITVYEHTPPGPAIWHQSDGMPLRAPDFHQIFERFNMEHYVNDLHVKEIWVWMGGGNADFPSYDPAVNQPEDFRYWWESNMSSPITGDISNSNRDNADLPIYDSTYTVYGQNIWRTQAEAVHNHGHQLEALLEHVSYLQFKNADLFWKQFVGQDAAGNFITGRAGWTHMPPNTTKHYDYTGTFTRVESDIEDWTPENEGARTLVNVETYGNLAYPWREPAPGNIPQRVESQWYIYWMQNMPGHKNQIQYNTQNMTNWWVFTADWDAAMWSKMGLVSETLQELPIVEDPDNVGANKPVELDALDLSLLPTLRSAPGDDETHIILVNRSDVDLHYYWVSGPEDAKFYGEVAGNSLAVLPTYPGHVWLIKDTHGRNIAVFRAVKQVGRATLQPAMIPTADITPEVATPPEVATTPEVPQTDFDDPFEGTALQNPRWRWQNEPTNWDIGETRKNFLHIAGEARRDLWTADATHLLYQKTSAEVFDLETRFFTKWNTPSGVNGLVVKSPADNDWVTLKFWARDPIAKGQIQYQAKGRGLAADPPWQPAVGTTELFFRLRKDQDTYTGWYKTKATAPWIKIGTAKVVLTPPLHIGIYAGVAVDIGTLTVDYAYFRSTVNTSGQGAPTLYPASPAVPTAITLLPNYPNPFNPETWIPYQLAQDSDVKISIYDARGSVVRVLTLGHQSAGYYTSRSRAAYWDGRNTFGERVASGVYVYQLQAGNISSLRKMTLLK